MDELTFEKFHSRPKHEETESERRHKFGGWRDTQISAKWDVNFIRKCPFRVRKTIVPFVLIEPASSFNFEWWCEYVLTDWE